MDQEEPEVDSIEDRKNIPMDDENIPVEQQDTQDSVERDRAASEVMPDVDHLTVLKQEAAELKAEIEQLKTEKQQVLQSQVTKLQLSIERIMQKDLTDLEQRKQELEASISILQRKQDRLQVEMKTTYAGVSQDVAVRVQGFKDYLVGSLQDLVVSAEKLNLAPPAKPVSIDKPVETKAPEPPLLSEQVFADQKQRIEQLLERYRTLPDYYGPAWKLRRTYETIHAERAAKWFFEQAGRGAVKSMGTRLQNILVAASIVSVLRSIYGDKMRVLILATAPERLGEWRRGFQDCLGISRDHFGPEKGVVLFEDSEPLATKGDRLVNEGMIPLVIMDEAEEYISVDMLRFPMMIAFSLDTQARASYRDRDFF